MSYDIHPTAIVDENAKIGESVTIGPYSVIGPEVIIGDGTTVESHVVIDGETIIGENNYIFSFVSIGKVPQDLKFKNEKTRVVIGNNNKIREFVTIHRGTDDKYETRIVKMNISPMAEALMLYFLTMTNWSEESIHP